MADLDIPKDPYLGQWCTWCTQNPEDHFLKIYIHSCIYLWLHWVFIAVHGLSLVSESGDYSLVVVPGLLISVTSLVEHRP